MNVNHEFIENIGDDFDIFEDGFSIACKARKEGYFLRLQQYVAKHYLDKEERKYGGLLEVLISTHVAIRFRYANQVDLLECVHLIVAGIVAMLAEVIQQFREVIPVGDSPYSFLEAAHQ